MIVSVGEISFESCDDANIPVSIFFSEVRENELKDLYREHDLEGLENAEKLYQVIADNYMPRRGTSSEGYHAVSDSKEELAALLREQVLPLYKIAFDKVTSLSSGELGGLYYWE